MQFEWQKETGPDQTVKKFLGTKGVSHRLISAAKQESDASFQLNGDLVDASEFVSVGDTIGFNLPDEPSDPNVPVSYEPLDIVAETNHWLVVNKEAGLTVVPGPANREDTLVNRIKGHLMNENSAQLVPHIITRLDRFTSGLVLVAKHRYANSLFSEQLANHELKKTYIAIVAGNMEKAHDLIDKPIRRADEGFNQIVAPDGKSAQTEYWVLGQNDDYSLVKVNLLTGRTHQIRVHFQAIGHPLLGDELYHGPLNLGISRQALHASELSFTDPFTGELQQFKADLPADMAQLNNFWK